MTTSGMHRRLFEHRHLVWNSVPNDVKFYLMRRLLKNLNSSFLPFIRAVLEMTTHTVSFSLEKVSIEFFPPWIILSEYDDIISQIPINWCIFVNKILIKIHLFIKTQLFNNFQLLKWDKVVGETVSKIYRYSK